jgi:hypothetical protein
MKKYKIINGIKHKAIGYTYDGKPIGWIVCGKSDLV